MSLPEIWFFVITFLFTGYFLLEGFDFGVGMLFPILGRTDERRRVLLNTIGPVWDGNEVWLITAGGAMFSAFPEWYATLFSGFYLPLLLIVLALILRVVAIEWRGKIDDPTWRARCDLGIMIGSWIPAFLWGVAFANIVRGVAINHEKQVTSGLFDLLNPYALLGGAAMVALFLLHGTVFVALKTGGSVRQDAVRLARTIALPVSGIAGFFVLWTQLAHGKAWTWWLVVVIAAALAGVVALTGLAREGWAFVLTSIAVIAAVVLLFASLYPNVLPSTTNVANSLTIANASSTTYTLRVMSWAAALTAPVVLIYQGWTYWVFRQRLSVDHIPASIGLPIRR
ncbi:cytochrome d ubiquinol oxidase subunit II [Skermania sp. ID1734]|uniref:cytochrome d ubiquinol oxidase subunit II n=1 Tax=Skermania sp. ID1734 TaxID=2597516 RepID=UPI001181374E|nr:cytochrome d ubiquinol oxidase subunit II [Skermania sp. ID1734]TSD96549.1 cytochrome d ubiquinol oxidase subunit II [Skermania sp. ID1734]